MAENLELRRSEFSQRLCDMTGCSQEEASKEVDIAIQRLFYWGAYADKYGGTVQVGVGINQLKLLKNTMWHEIFSGVYFCGLAICCVLWGLIFAIRTDWFFLLGINFCDFQKLPSIQH